MKRHSRTVLALSALSSVTLALPSGGRAADVVIGVPDRSSVNATANMMRVAIEENLGLDVELQNGTKPVIFEAMGKGSMHVYPEIWLPNRSSLVDQYSARVTRNENAADAVPGISVNQGVQDAGITDIADPWNSSTHWTWSFICS